MPRKKEGKRVVITGIGPICAIGCGKEELWSSILKEETGLGKEKYIVDGELWDEFLVHKIKFFDIKRFNLDKRALDEITQWKENKPDNDLYYSLAATKLAIDDSKIAYNKENNNLGLFCTIEHPGFEPFCEGIIKEALSYLSKNPSLTSKKQIYKHLYDEFVDKGYDLQTFMYLYLISKAFSIHGYSLFTSNACASGLYAMDAAFKQIKYGSLETAVVVGGDDTRTMFKHMWFKERNLYAKDGKIKPFSKNADGIVFGDGFSAIVMEDMEHALKRGADIYAEYLGGGFSLEGWKVVFPDITGDSYQNAIKQVLEETKISPKEIDLINPHGVGIKITDKYEAMAITEIFGRGKKCPPVSAFKPYIGHNLGGSAILESIILILSMQNNIIPATLNCQDFDEKYEINLVSKPSKREIKTAIKLSCGFAGYNAACVFRKE